MRPSPASVAGGRQRMKRSLVGVGFSAMGSLAAIAFAVQTPAVAASTEAGPLAHSPIKHVVVIYQENHSFNDLLGRLCVDEHDRCVGTTEGVISDGTRCTLHAGAGHPAGRRTRVAPTRSRPSTAGG